MSSGIDFAALNRKAAEEKRAKERAERKKQDEVKFLKNEIHLFERT